MVINKTSQLIIQNGIAIKIASLTTLRTVIVLRLLREESVLLKSKLINLIVLKKFFTILVVVSLSAPSAKVFAQENAITSSPKPEEVKGFYGTLGLGYSATQDISSSDSILGVPVKGNFALTGGFAGETGLGYDFGSVRTELTYIYNNASLNSLDLSVAGVGVNAPISEGNVNTNSVMASVYVDIPTNSRWVPYVGGGLGYSSISWGAYRTALSGSTFSQNAGSQGVLGYQAKVGLSYLANKKTDVFVEGVYQGTSNFSIDTTNYDPLSSWGARLGARFRF